MRVIVIETVIDPMSGEDTDRFLMLKLQQTVRSGEVSCYLLYLGQDLTLNAPNQKQSAKASVTDNYKARAAAFQVRFSVGLIQHGL